MIKMVFFEIIKSLRPQQWTKNLFIFAAIIFSQEAFTIPLLFKASIAFFVFCALSGSLYIFNDIIDLKKDRLHPLKSKRPLAAERITRAQAVTGFIIFSTLGILLALTLNLNFIWIVLLFFILQIAYSFWLKHIVILDVFVISIGFVIRVAAGAMAIKVDISPWLLICTLLLALFLALSKRRHELFLLKGNAGEHRTVLDDYSSSLLDQMISVVTASTVIAYCLYTISEETVAKFGTHELIYTVPFVLYGIFRYLYLIHHKFEGGTPETLILKDKPLLAAILFWIISAFFIIYLRG
jgi:4-hydroxybenzoate polyprenyltransferase